MNKKVPFVANSKDRMHCVPAVFRMLNQYYFGEDFTWEEIDEILKVKKGKGTWTLPGLTKLSKKGLEILIIEATDYKELYKDGPDYLTKFYGKDTADYYLKNSNFKSVIPLIPEFLKNVEQINREATIEDIVKYLNQGSLIGVDINPRILNNKDGFSLHHVLIYDFDGDSFFLHDPGPPPKKSRKVMIEDFKKAFAYPGANLAIAVFRKK